MSASSALGESWVVASVQAENDVTSKKLPRTPIKTSRFITEDQGDGSGSVSASTSSMSGPELIMPSIYETPLSEGSWVAPTVRKRQTNPGVRRGHQPSAEPARVKKTTSDTSVQASHSTTTPKDQTQFKFKLFETPIRSLANIILLAAISHLLVLPELVQQYQSMCSIGPILSLYPSSCLPRYPQPFNPLQHHTSAPLEPIISSQTRLEALFNGTLHDMAPLNGSLKQTESQLRIVERELKHTHPGTKHELGLEFGSCWRAIRFAAWKFDSLKVDLQSAVDSLVAAGDVRPKAGAVDSRSSSPVAQDARLSTQMLHREQYLDQLTSRMRSKADSLAADLATLDDHLESIEGIVQRETSNYSPSQAKGSSSRGPSKRLSAFLGAIVPSGINIPSFLQPLDRELKEEDDSNPNSRDRTLSEIFSEATAHHRPVAELARTLSKQLHLFLQNKRGISF
ncbi:hypothetical protein BJX99DRAFT_217861 [Aspergillus californicus]